MAHLHAAKDWTAEVKARLAHLRPKSGVVPPEVDWRIQAEGVRVLPDESLEDLLRAIGEETTRGLRSVSRHRGQFNARYKADQAAAAPRVERREYEAVSTWLAGHPILGLL